MRVTILSHKNVVWLEYTYNTDTYVAQLTEYGKNKLYIMYGWDKIEDDELELLLYYRGGAEIDHMDDPVLLFYHSNGFIEFFWHSDEYVLRARLTVKGERRCNELLKKYEDEKIDCCPQIIDGDLFLTMVD